MPFIKLDQKILTNPRTAQLSDSAFGLFVRLITWCSIQMSDGRFTVAEVSLLCKRRGMMKSLKCLCDVGVVSVNGDDYVIIGYTEHQTPRAQIEANKAKATEKKRGQRESGPQGTPAPRSKKEEVRNNNAEGTIVPPTPRAAASPKAKTWKHVPDDWKPHEAHAVKAKKLNLNLDAEVEAYRNHCYDRPKVNADKTFYTWMANTIKFGTQAGSAPRQGLRGNYPVSSAQAQQDRQMERIRQAEAEEKADAKHPQIVEMNHDQN